MIGSAKATDKTNDLNKQTGSPWELVSCETKVAFIFPVSNHFLVLRNWQSQHLCRKLKNFDYMNWTI